MMLLATGPVSAGPDDTAWMDALIQRVDPLLDDPLASLESGKFSRLMSASIISPVGERSGHVWVYQLASKDDGSVNLQVRLRPFEEAESSRKLSCDYIFELRAREARYVLGLAHRALYCDKPYLTRSVSFFPLPCLTDESYPDPVCIGGSTSIIRLQTKDGEEVRIASKCGAIDETGQFLNAIQTFAHPVYSRPNESCEQNQTPENLIKTSEE